MTDALVTAVIYFIGHLLGHSLAARVWRSLKHKPQEENFDE